MEKEKEKDKDKEKEKEKGGKEIRPIKTKFTDGEFRLYFGVLYSRIISLQFFSC